MLGSTAWVHARAGRPDVARAVFDELAARARYEPLSPGYVAVAAAAAGLADEAAAWLALAVEQRDPVTLYSRAMPFFEEVRALPRFAELTRPLWGA
jgi:hypothetical protein